MYTPLKITLSSLIALAFSPAMAFSLFDGAPPIGLPESKTINYNAHLAFGWDDNINASSDNRESSPFANFSISANTSEVEAATTYSYNARLGGTLYESDANNTSDTLFADCSLTASFSHQIDSARTVSANLSLTYSPQPDYSNGISATNVRGDVLNWDIALSYSHSLDTRWSLSGNTSYSGNVYGDNEYSSDNREYISVGGSINYVCSTLTTYSLNVSGQFDVHQIGKAANSLYVSGTVKTSLSPISSVSVTGGIQMKNIASENNFYPTMDISYNRSLPEGTSLRFYVSLDNENIDTYQANSGTYLSDASWRTGATLTKRLTSLFSVAFDFSLNTSYYGDAITQEGATLNDKTSITVNFTPSISYNITSTLSATLSYNYTIANDQGGDYNRSKISSSLSYSF